MAARVFLDFDGVLNPENARPSGPPTDWRASVADGVPIVWSPTIVRSVAGLASRAEVLWLTTWAERAQLHLEPLLGLPELALAGPAPSDVPWRWWKHDVVEAFWNEDARPFVWIDDDLPLFTEADDWVRGLPRDLVLAIAPDPVVGLTLEHLDEVHRFVASHEDR